MTSPALMSILSARAYLGGLKQAAFYARVLPHVEVVKLGRRTMVTVASLDRFIEEQKSSGLPPHSPNGGRP